MIRVGELVQVKRFYGFGSGEVLHIGTGKDEGGISGRALVRSFDGRRNQWISLPVYTLEPYCQ